MTKPSSMTLLSLIIFGAGALLMLMVPEFSWASGLLAAGGTYIAINVTKSRTGSAEYISFFLNSALTAIAIEIPRQGFPFIGLCLAACAIGLTTRLIFVGYISYTRFIWMEPVFGFFSFGFWLVGNILEPVIWEGWVLPLVSLFYMVDVSIGMFTDNRKMLAFTREGYGAKIGKPAPDFSLPDQNNNMVSLSDFRNQRDLLLIFIRGDWCPICQMMLRTYMSNSKKFQSKNIMLVAIGPDPVGVNHNLVVRLGLDYKLLSDSTFQATKKYGVQIVDYNNSGPDSTDEGLPLPASFLIDRKGIVRYSSRPDRVGEFLNPSLIFPILDSLPN